MQFKIKMCCEVGSTTINITHINKIQKAAGTPNLPLDVIDANVDGQRTWRVPVSEGIARASGRFKEHAITQVTLRPTNRPGWWELVPEIPRDHSTGAVMHARMVWEFQPTWFLRDWASAGYPNEM